MQQTNKIKISQKEIDDIYEIEEITEEIKEVIPIESAKPLEDTTPKSILTEEEELQDKIFHDALENKEDENAS